MESSDEVTLWRGVSPRQQDPEREVIDGFSADDYPGDGPYFATDRRIAEEFAACYRRGLQELHVPQAVFDKLVLHGHVQPDGYYPAGQSWCVPPNRLPEFNAAIRLGTPNRFHLPTR